MKTRVKHLLPSQERLRELFTYEKDGHLARKKSSGGQFAGHSTRDNAPNAFSGYRIVRIDGKAHVLHRAVWQWHNKEPLGYRELDHKNGIRTDCRYENLRVCDIPQNSWNSRKRSKKKGQAPASKYIGVSPSRRDNGTLRWRSRIRVRGTFISLGSDFLTEEDAYAARVAAEKKYHKEFAAHLRKES